MKYITSYKIFENSVDLIKVEEVNRECGDILQSLMDDGFNVMSEVKVRTLLDKKMADSYSDEITSLELVVNIGDPYFQIGHETDIRLDKYTIDDKYLEDFEHLFSYMKELGFDYSLDVVWGAIDDNFQYYTANNIEEILGEGIKNLKIYFYNNGANKLNRYFNRVVHNLNNLI